MKEPTPLELDTQAAFRALKRAAKSARKLAEATGTPLYVLQGGRVVNLNPVRKKRTKQS